MQHYRVDSVVAPETLTFVGSGTVSSRITYRLSTPGAGTTRVECDYELSDVGGTIASLTGTMQGQLDKEMDALKERCEQAS
ncbi:hypothetical protein ACTQ49_02575 [Luteococcus sp. Sow4_B9]|uniref:hypothetical protein n=1 Tax=Luteococcus sp. Sow4_B9 TaxID=3438792 RepID=UPI003F9A64B3